ncbi:MAG TPA: flagellar export protein FliJ [Candidatus Acidoferrales bacterium]|nr:flagellar export protein FliJ [Candidatus Acidoferrales bacterium]
MAFRFPLEAVFHFRQSVEHQEELRLRAANQHLARARHLLEHVDQRIAEMRTRQSQQLTEGTTAAELRFALLCDAALHDERREIERQILRLEALRDKQQTIYRRARRERETFESLRNRQLAEYRRGQARREQRQLDDLFLLRQAYQRHS